MRLLEFKIENQHFLLNGEVRQCKKIDSDDGERRYLFEATEMQKESNGIFEPYKVTAVTFIGQRLNADDVLMDIAGRMSRNETGKLEVLYTHPELKRILDEFKKYPAIDNGDRIIPFFIMYRDVLARLKYATNEFLFYLSDDGLPIMYRTSDGSLVSDNEFADMGLALSEENVENGSEYVLEFKEYDEDLEIPFLEDTPYGWEALDSERVENI